MRRLSVAVRFAGAMGLISCQAIASRPDVAAVLVDPSPQTRAELSKAVSEMLGVSSSVLADDALRRSSTLVIERRPTRDLDRVRVSGRDRDKPITFNLLKSGSGCVLTSARDGKRRVLASAACREFIQSN